MRTPESFGKWYQQIDLDGKLTCDNRAGGGDYVWEKMRELLPATLAGKRIIDFGCNAGCYCVHSAIAGADEVIGIDIRPTDLAQAAFIKRFFEDKLNCKLNISFVQGDLSEIDLKSFGHFDYAYALAILYHIGTSKYGEFTPPAFAEQQRIVSILCSITDNVITRTWRRKYRNIEHFEPMFAKSDFTIKKIIHGDPADGRREIALWSR